MNINVNNENFTIAQKHYKEWKLRNPNATDKDYSKYIQYQSFMKTLLKKLT